MNSTQTIVAYVQRMSGKRDANETVKREAFLSLMKDLFPEQSRLLEEYVLGGEKAVRVEGKAGTGRIDSLFGNLVIEFERDLRRVDKLEEGEYQLKEYVSGLWNEQTKRVSYVGIVSDGMTWRCYFPTAPDRSTDDGKLTPEQIGLAFKDEYILKDASTQEADGFFLFLDRYFFRTTRLTPSTDVFQRDFGLSSIIWERARTQLETVLGELHDDTEISTAYSQWERYLTYTYGSPEANQSLFVRHTYLTMLARTLVAVVLYPGDILAATTETVHAINTGEFFEQRNIKNLVDRDFFHWVERPSVASRLEGLWLAILSQLKTYDFDALEEDILKGVYQELVDPKDRHDLGEYYTPDWLCNRVVDHAIELVDSDETMSVLDPTCGSGSFLRSWIERQIDHLGGADAIDDPERRVREITSRVVGLDVHPLAVTVAKANYLIALRDLLPKMRRATQVPVYLSDSLFLPEAEMAEEGELFESYQEYGMVNFQGSRHRFPITVFSRPELYDLMITLAADAAENLAKDLDESVSGMIGALRRQDTGLNEDELAQAGQAVFGLAKELAVRIRRKEDSIWAFVLRNSYRPALLRSKFDVVVGNPPWLSYRYISDPQYQGEIKNLAVTRYGVAPKKQKLMTHMELATLFLVHVTHTYLKPGGVLGFVMPRSIFNADQHERLRTETFQADCDMIEYWDLESVAPLFNVPTCVAFATKGKTKKNKRYNARFYSGRLRRSDVPWSVAKNALESENGFIYTSWLGSRNALTRRRLKAVPTGEAPYYLNRFFQGATIVPRNFYFVEPTQTSWEHLDVVPVRTDPEQQKEAKQPWKPLTIEGRIERELLYRTALSKHLLPFLVVPDIPLIALPMVVRERKYQILHASEVLKEGFRDGARWFKEAENLWSKYRAAKADSMSFADRLDYQKGLTRQNPESHWTVMYNALGTNVSAALYDQTSNHRVIVDYKTYFMDVATETEGLYLVGVFNSDAVNDAIKPFQPKGLMGERGVERLPLELPIPPFEPDNALHREIAELARVASDKVRTAYDSGKIDGTLGKRRGLARDAARVEIEASNKAVVQLLSAG